MIAGILLVALIAAALWRLGVDPGTQVGVIAGICFGILLGPARLAGVDFRQWFRNPKTPSEIGDDTYIGLIRNGFHLLAFSGLLGSLALSFTACHWVPYQCTPFGASIPGATWDVVVRAAGIFAGMFFGIAMTQAIVEALWRYGLGFFVPPPERRATKDYLAQQPLPYLPPKQDREGRRRLIVCCDGTWNWPAPDRETNVVRIVRAIAPQATVGAKEIPQIVHYHQGVGTGNFVDRLLGGGVGIGLSASVKACYGFLVDNYRPGDEIFLIGFSRGAYVARALGGVIGALGMLRKEDMCRFADAWNWYWQARSKRRPADLDGIAPERQRDVEIQCVAVFDTVGALGIPGSRFCKDAFAFHETQLGTHVRHAFQALAIDEQRGNFQGAIWVPTGEEDARQNPPADYQRQVLTQMWFPGAHSNIGGGYEKHGLSDATFLWMLSQLGAMLAFDEAAIARSLDADTQETFPGGKLEDSRTLFWKLIGSPIPRPVCVVSSTEYIHESVALRAVPDGIYQRPARRAWIDAMSQARPSMPNPVLVAPRTVAETAMAALRRTPPVARLPIKKKLDVCNWLVSLVSARS